MSVQFNSIQFNFYCKVVFFYWSAPCCRSVCFNLFLHNLSRSGEIVRVGTQIVFLDFFYFFRHILFASVFLLLNYQFFDSKFTVLKTTRYYTCLTQNSSLEGIRASSFVHFRLPSPPFLLLFTFFFCSSTYILVLFYVLVLAHFLLRLFFLLYFSLPLHCFLRLLLHLLFFPSPPFPCLLI